MSRFQSAIAALALLAIAPLGACSKVEDGKTADAAEQSVGGTLASAISEAPDLRTVASGLTDAGLGEVFDGPGSYTVLAPDDDAFAALGEGQRELTSDEARPVLVAVLRDHILPGHMTPDAIREAIERKGGPVTVTTLGEGSVTFSLDGDAIVAKTTDGATVRLDGPSIVASNGVAIPVDGLLKQPQPLPQ